MTHEAQALALHVQTLATAKGGYEGSGNVHFADRVSCVAYTALHLMYERECNGRGALVCGKGQIICVVIVSCFACYD